MILSSKLVPDRITVQYHHSITGTQTRRLKKHKSLLVYDYFHWHTRLQTAENIS